MKITIKENTRLNGNHLSRGETHEVEEKDGKFLVRLGRASEVKEKINPEDLVTKTEQLENVTNKEEDLKTKVTKRKTKGE